MYILFNINTRSINKNNKNKHILSHNIIYVYLYKYNMHTIDD